MAGQKIHGITIDLDVNTSGVTEGFKEINKSINVTSKELKTVDNLLKEDSGNITLLTQKQKLLTDAIESTTAKLSQLSLAKVKADRTGEIDKNGKEYRELERDILNTKKRLEELTQQQKDNNDQWDKAKRGITQVGNSLDETSKKAVDFGDIFKANLLSDLILDGIKALAEGTKDVAREMHQWADDYRELEVYEKQFENNIRNTADATDDEIKALKNLAKQKQREGVISSRAITSAYQELATYVESTDAIEGLTDALVDMSAQQYGVDASAESVRNLATTLGKALANGDYSGLTRLGYGFTEAQQRIMEYGTELERVKVINDVIADSIGGMNKALAETDAGQMFQVQQYFADTQNILGGLMSELETEFISKVMPDIQGFIDNIVGFLVDHKDEMIQMVDDVASFFTAEDTKQFFMDVGQIVIDIATIIGQIAQVLSDMGLLSLAWETFKAIVQGVKDIFDEIVSDIRYIQENGFGAFFKGNYDSYDSYGSDDPFVPGWSGGYGALNSGGHSVTLNPVFNIHANNVTRADVRQWSQWMLDDINDGLGRAI